MLPGTTKKMTVLMNVVQQHAVIRFMMLQRKPKKIHKELVATLGDNALLYTTVKRWATLFKDGWESVDDDS